MSKVSNNAAAAFCCNKPFKNGRSSVNASIPQTEVTVESTQGNTIVTMRLHGSIIAKKYVESRRVMLTLAGYGTPTTRSRLNALIDHMRIERRFGGRMGYSQTNHEQVFTDSYGDAYTIDPNSAQYFSEYPA